MILAYHNLDRERANYLYSVTCRQFDEHLQLIKKRGMEKGANSSGVQVTFDDGHISNYENGLGLLQKYRIPAIYFITGGWIGTCDEAMSWEQLQEMVSLGHQVQSHGWSHALLTHCSNHELREELRRSKCEIEDHLASRVHSISLPGGRWNRRVLEICAEEGYDSVYTSYPWGRSTRRQGVTLHGRLMVHNRLTAAELERLLEMSSVTMLFPRARILAQEAIRLFLGDQGYIRLWRIFARQKKRPRDREFLRSF